MPLFRTSFVVLCFLVSQQAIAHKLNVFAYVEGNQVHVDGYFADGKKARDSEITVYDMKRELIAEGITDNEGAFNFSVQRSDDLRIVINAGMGHMAEMKLLASEFDDSAAASSATVSTSPESTHNEAIVAQTNNGDIAAIVEKAVNNAVKPLTREIAELKSKTTMSDIVGGIGIMLGILGIFAYVAARKEKEKNKT